MGNFTNPYILALKLFGTHLVIMLASIIFMPTFSALIDSNIGIKVYSSVTALFFLSAYYSSVWNAGRKDAKHVKVYNKHNEDKKVIKYSKGIVVGLLAAIPSIILLIILTVTAIIGQGYDWANVVYRVFQSIFMGWLGNDNLTYIPNCYIITLIPILLAVPAYIAGTKEYSLLEKYLPKIIYKRTPKKDADKKNK